MKNTQNPITKRIVPGKIYRRLLLLALLFSLGLFAVPTSPVYAAMQSCRGDPIFYLSNGSHITSITTVYTASSNVVNTTFVLHAPQGLSVTKILYLTATSTISEPSSVVFDQPAGVYWVDVYVNSKVSGVSVTATGQFNTGTVKTVSGLTGQHLKITLP